MKLHHVLILGITVGLSLQAEPQIQDEYTSDSEDNFLFSDELVDPPQQKSAEPPKAPVPVPSTGVLAPIKNTSAADLARREPKPVPSRSEPLSPAVRKGRRIDLEFKNAKLKEVLKVIARESRQNYIYPDEVGEKTITISLQQVPWAEALEAILDSRSLGMTRLKSGIVRIDDKGAFTEEKKKDEQNAKANFLTTPTQIFVYQLSYSKAEDVINIVKSLLPPPEEDRRVKVQADARTNSIIIEAIPRDLRKIRSLISRIDLQTPQVKIKTRIIEVIDLNDKFLGINWSSPYRNDQSNGGGFGNLVFPNSMNSAFSVDTGIAPATLANRGAFDFHFGSINNAFELDLRLRMSELQRNTRTLQNNTFIVLNNQPAVIEAGQEEFFSVPQGNGRNEMSSVKYTLRVEVTPHITADGSIKMDINVASAAPIPSENQTAAANKNLRNLTTYLIRKNNETAVIGGLYTTDVSSAQQGIPFFSKIPLIGVLFKSNKDVENKRELIIMVTPSIISNDQDLSLEKFREEMAHDSGAKKPEQTP
jgi:type IV pilus assembly protein PilQ